MDLSLTTRRALLLGAAAGACVRTPSEDVVQSIDYSPHGLNLDIYPASGARRPAPAALLLHGGGWYEGHRRDMAPLAAWLSRHGVRPIAVQYRLTGEGARWPAPAQDVRAAIWWCRDHADTLGIDPDQVIGVGYSSGGHLAAWCGVSDEISPAGTRGRFDQVIAIAAPWDLAAPPGEWSGEVNLLINMLLGDTPRAAASPLCLIDAHTAPTLLIHGEADDTVPIAQSARAFRALQMAGAASTFERLPGRDHDSLVDPGVLEHTLAPALDFIRRGGR